MELGFGLFPAPTSQGASLDVFPRLCVRRFQTFLVFGLAASRLNGGFSTCCPLEGGEVFVLYLGEFSVLSSTREFLALYSIAKSVFVRFLFLGMSVRFRIVDGAPDLWRRLEKAGHKVLWSDDGSEWLVPFEDHGDVRVQKAGLEAHFGCVLEVVE